MFVSPLNGLFVLLSSYTKYKSSKTAADGMRKIGYVASYILWAFSVII